ncbi:MAG: thymidine phosphorylase, partial [Gammaproteobacteria bacterium]|nr:thymidine phosphorylase [Gammaproteobacteria bacterium]
MNDKPAINLQLRRVAIDTYKENVAYLHRDCTVYRSEGFQALSKVEIRPQGDGVSVLATLNVVDDPMIAAPGQVGLSLQAFEQLGLPEGTPATVAHAKPPGSLHAVHRKIAGERLGYDDYLAITRDIVDNRYAKIEMAAFLVACSETGMERDEVLYLTRAMADSGERLNWREPLVADKHCIGGIPGNRTSMLVVPIVSAHGMVIPKTSSRAITSPAGTADTMEVLAAVELPLKRLDEIIRTERGCLAWGGTARLAPVDDILISVERPLSIDSPGQLV